VIRTTRVGEMMGSIRERGSIGEVEIRGRGSIGRME